MEDVIEIILQDQDSKLFRRNRESPILFFATGAIFSCLYGFWFCLPGLKVPFRLKVPFLPSTKDQTQNVLKLLEGRRGQLADLGSGDGRLVFAACAAGFQCTGFEINPMLLTYSRVRAWWRGIPHTRATFVNQDFWKGDSGKGKHPKRYKEGTLRVQRLKKGPPVLLGGGFSEVSPWCYNSDDSVKNYCSVHAHFFPVNAKKGSEPPPYDPDHNKRD